MRFELGLLSSLILATSASAQNYQIQPPPPSWGPVWTIPQPQPQQPPQQQPQQQMPQQLPPQEAARDDAIVVDMSEGQANAANTPNENGGYLPQFSVPQTAPNSAPVIAPIDTPMPNTQTRYSSEAAAVGIPSPRQTMPQQQASAAPNSMGQIRTQSQMAQTSRGLSSAVTCAAALQIAALAAPSWSSEHGVAQATNLWLERVFTEADKAAVSGDRVNNLVKEEMEKQTSAAANDPNLISRKAFDCATNMPK